MRKLLKSIAVPFVVLVMIGPGMVLVGGASAAPGQSCQVPRGISVGATVAIRQATGMALHWDTAGSVLRLAKQGSGKEVVLVASTNPGGPSSPVGSCLLSGSYIRFASTKHAEPDRYLIAYKAVNPDYVQIGNYPDPQVDSIFFVVKAANVASNSTGPEILRGDVVHIRGVSRDPWLSYPTDAAPGSPVLLADDNEASASPWIFGHRDDDGFD